MDGNGRGTFGLTGVTFLVVLAVAEPFAELVALFDVDDGDVVVLGKGGHELHVLGVFAVLGEDAKNGFLAVKSLADLVETFHKT